MKAVLRYLGGKNRYAREIIEHFPPHFCYLEPCGGSAGVLLNKAPSAVEIYNDLDGEVVNFFRVLRNGNSGELIDAIRLTPYSREELNHARPVKDPVERARRFLVRSWFGIANDASRDASSGFRVSRNRQPTVAADWKNLPETLEKAVERLRNVYIEQRDALELISRHDGPETLHFIDPPYLKSTRTREGSYTHNSPMHNTKTCCGWFWIAGGKWCCAGTTTRFTTTPFPAGARSATEPAPAWGKNGWNACG